MPVWNAKIVDIQDEPGVAGYLIWPAHEYAEAQLLVRQHMGQLHSAPWWTGAEPRWLEDWRGDRADGAGEDGSDGG